MTSLQWKFEVQTTRAFGRGCIPTSKANSAEMTLAASTHRIQEAISRSEGPGNNFHSFVHLTLSTGGWKHKYAIANIKYAIDDDDQITSCVLEKVSDTSVKVKAWPMTDFKGVLEVDERLPDVIQFNLYRMAQFEGTKKVVQSQSYDMQDVKEMTIGGLGRSVLEEHQHDSVLGRRAYINTCQFFCHKPERWTKVAPKKKVKNIIKDICGDHC